MVIAVGFPAARCHNALRIRRARKNPFAILVHPRAWVGQNANTCEGSVICAGFMITTDIQIGRHDQVYIGATIGYDAVLEDLVTLNPSVNVFGNVKFEEGVETGTSSVLLPRCEMGCGVIIEAGSVVTKSLSPNVMAVGAPVKAIKELTQDWHKGPDA